MSKPRKAITYQFPVTATVVLEGGAHEHYPTETEVQEAIACTLHGLCVRAKFSSYDARVVVGAAESSSEGLVP